MNDNNLLVLGGRVVLKELGIGNWATPGSVYGLLLVICSSVSTGRDLYVVLRMEMDC